MEVKPIETKDIKTTMPPKEISIFYTGRVVRERGGWSIGAAAYERLDSILPSFEGEVISMEIKISRKD